MGPLVASALQPSELLTMSKSYWLMKSEPHVYSTDWLFTGTVVPEPGTGTLLGLGLLGLATAGRKRLPRFALSDARSRCSKEVSVGHRLPWRFIRRTFSF